jgi:AbiV family abortive infection protein
MIEAVAIAEIEISRNVRQKVERWTILCYQNCVRLHEDSVILYKQKRYPTAHALSVIALEEMGKYHMLAHGLFSGFFNDEKSAKLILDDIYDHKAKQRIFMNRDVHELFWRDSKHLDEKAQQDLKQIYKTYGYDTEKSLKYFPSIVRL